jgi:penicillin amidase
VTDERASTAPSAEQLPVAGLQSRVVIAIDPWGVPHIRAGNETDLFFAQGFNAARDRLWQIDLWRKRGLGLLAADFGPGFLPQDRAARLFLYRGDMDAEWASYGSGARAICEAFVNGINSYIDLVEQNPDRLPPEFSMLGTRPSKWRAEDVVRIRSHGWMRNAISEVLRANVVVRESVDADRLRMNLEPPVTPHVADGVDLSAIPMDVLDVYKLATAPVVFERERLQASSADAWNWTTVTPSGEVVRRAGPQESNNWAVHGSRTITGRPILASDPHRIHSVPSLRYLVHLTAPGIDVIGAGEPSFPGIAIGHNGEAAFGLTLFLGPDQEDVYVYETNATNPSSYRYGGTWEEMRLVDETFQVKGQPSETLTLRFTRHGPVVYEDAASHRAFAIRTVWSEPGTAPYGASLLAMRSRTCDEFRRAMRAWRVPAVNQVYADRSGDIAWITAGLSPVRRNWDGLLPVPGDGRYEWDGFLDPDLLPATRNPKVGFVLSANAMNLPADWPRRDRPIGYEWDDASRANRIREVLDGDRRHSIAGACALQNDVVSLPARRLCALLDAIESDDHEMPRALAMLEDWNHELRPESAPAALFEIWWSRHLRPRLLERLVPDSQARSFIVPGDIESVVSTLESSRALAPASRNALLAVTLSEAFRDATALMGSDANRWSWGRVHNACFEHPLSAFDGPSRRLAPDIGPFVLGGSESTVMKATYRPGDFRVTIGASVRMVADVGDWDRSVWINTPGQSGDPRSRHYGDLAPLWARGEYVPMLYSPGAVDNAAERRIILNPER